MSLLDKAKKAAEQAATKAKEGVEDVQTRRDLTQAYTDLGKTAFGLMESGELSDARLEPAAERIRTLSTKLATVGSPDAAAPSSEPYDPDQPPAMPS